MKEDSPRDARLVVPRNVMAAALSDPMFRSRTVRPAKGPGSYSRQPKHRAQAEA